MLKDIEAYFNERGLSTVESEQFFNFYELRGWTNARCQKLSNWKLAAAAWVRSIQRQYPQLVRPGHQASLKSQHKPTETLPIRPLILVILLLH